MDALDPRHGTQAGRSQHYRDNEDPCDACLHGDAIAGRRRRKRASMGHVHTMDLDDATRGKLERLRDRGATYDQLVEWSGVEFRSIYAILNGEYNRVHTKTYRKLIEFRPPPFVTAIGMTRRVRALQALGYSLPKIGAAMGGLSYPRLAAIRDGEVTYASHDTRTRLAAAYDRLCMTPAPSETVGERKSTTRARNKARENGWVPPLGWTDIDDPDEKPVGYVGDQVARMSQYADAKTRAADLAELDSRGVGISEACRALNISRGALQQWCKRKGLSDVYRRLAMREDYSPNGSMGAA